MPQFILINKPVGPTSHDIIDYLRKITGIQKIGHAGTLDPFASGLLLAAVGRDSTREISKFVGLDKEYEATLKLGAVSDSYDLLGQITITNHQTAITKNDIERVVKIFIGEQEQIPPMFSAKKINGKKLYHLARKGIEIERKPSKIKIYQIKNINWLPVDSRLPAGKAGLSFVVSCSTGTYIRSLAHDIGQKLGCGAYLEKLIRTKIGDFKLEDAVELNQLTPENWQRCCQNF